MSEMKEPKAQPIASGGSRNGEKPKRGRRSADESVAKAIRTRLASWLLEPEDQRPSLRELAVELGTSHQLLSFYLKGLNDWQRKDCKRRAQAIRNLADAENRFTTPWEESQIRALEHASSCCMIDSILQPILDRWEAHAKARTLSKQELKCITLFAQRGVPIAQEILKRHRNNLPVVESNGVAKPFSSTSR
jgi:hypothetical protein